MKETQNLLKDKIAIENMNLLYKNLLVSVPASLFCATIVFVAFYRIPHTYILIYWYIAMVIITTIRLMLAGFYYTQHFKQLNLNMFMITTAIAALLWGFAGSILMPENYVIEQMIAVIILAGVTAGAMQSLQANFLTCVIYTVLSLLPLCIWIFLRNNTSYHILGIATSLYLLFLISISWRNNKFLNETLKLKHANIDLVENLSTTNQSLIEKENNLRIIHDNAPIGMAIVSLDEKWSNVNNKLCEIVGYNKSELDNSSIQDLTYQDDMEIDEDKKAKLLKGKILSYQVEKRFIHKNGQVIWILINVSLVRDKDNKPLYFITQIEDINDRKQNEKIITGLNNMNEKLQLCHDSIEAYPIIGRTANDLFLELSGGLAIFNKVTNEMETVERWGNNPLLKSFFKYSECWGFRAGNIYEVSNTNNDMICKHFDSAPRGSYICLPLIVQNETIGIISFNSSAENAITSYQKNIINNFSEIVKLSLANIYLNEALRDQSIHDALTGLVNRRYLYEWFPQVLNHIIHTKKTLCFCMIDIDYFKRINDKYGHEAGDELLICIGKILKSNVRESDIACRFGGDEFIIVLLGSDANHAQSQMQHIRDEIYNAKIFSQNQSLPPITLSIGIAEAPRFGNTLKDLLLVADDALYKAKQGGRNKIVVAEYKENAY